MLQIIKFLEKVKLSEGTIAIEFCSQLLSRAILLAGIDLSLPEIYAIIGVGNLNDIFTHVENGFGIHVNTLFNEDYAIDFAIGDFKLDFRKVLEDILIEMDANNPEAAGEKSKFFGMLSEYVSLDAIQAYINMAIDLEFGLGANNNPNDTNALRFEALLTEIAGSNNFEINIIDMR
ncbi:MAG: hypothetical protein EOM87_09810 [Clostridia bacterium]|nr:hypothetical protein [Clostridia bacterium]